jgi:hypothetical protein
LDSQFGPTPAKQIIMNINSDTKFGIQDSINAATLTREASCAGGGAGADADGPAQGREQERATRRPPGQMGPLVKLANILCTL